MTELAIIPSASPNFSSRHFHEMIGTVIHYTADGPEWNPVKWLRMRSARASAHYVILRNGVIHKLVDVGDKAWHAGHSEWTYKGETKSDVNAYTVGIELANAGLLTKRGERFLWGGNARPYKGPEPVQAALKFDDGHEVSGWWEPYDEQQLTALEGLLGFMDTQGDYAQNLVGHEEIGMPLGRKIDPGPLFPWERFSARRLTERRTESLAIVA